MKSGEVSDQTAGAFAGTIIAMLFDRAGQMSSTRLGSWGSDMNNKPLVGSSSEFGVRLLAGVSLVALGLSTAPAYAQDTAQAAETTSESGSTSTDAAPKSDSSTVVVTGVRKALESARARKRNADTVIDSISATDIGAFPDKSVAEALQRVPGISVTRFAIPTDPAHFTTEPSGVLVRGLPQVRNEFNGRDTFSANAGRTLSWGDVPAELLGGVDIYKNQTADLIEGGIAGLVNLRTRVPFTAAARLSRLESRQTGATSPGKSRPTPTFSTAIAGRPVWVSSA